MTKIAMLGAGSTVFAKNLLTDILSYPEFAKSTITLHDIDSTRLETTLNVARRVAESYGVFPVIEVHLDRRAALDGADYAIGMFQVGGYDPATITDFEIPKRFGLRQTIADTLGIGGIMRGLRTIPVYLEMCRDMEAVCPDVLLLNYVNPMAMVTWAINRATPIRVVGLCHSVQGTAEQLANLLGIPSAEVNYLCAGINHMAFYLKFERNGEDLYPLIQKAIEDKQVPTGDRVRFEMLKRLGYFVTESSEHFSEYTPWFIKGDRPDLIETFNIPLDEYLRRCKVQIAGWELGKEILENPNATVDPVKLIQTLRSAGANDDDVVEIQKILAGFDDQQTSSEYGARIIHSMETGEPCVVYGNVMNNGLIDNLLEQSINIIF